MTREQEGLEESTKAEIHIELLKKKKKKKNTKKDMKLENAWT